MGQDTRKDPRAKVLSLNVRYKSATVDEFIEHHSHDISKGGIFIKTPSPFPAGTLLKFEIRIREDQPLIAGVGRVVWKREPPQAGAERPAGMGVKFIKLDGHSRELIDRIVADRKEEGPSFEETPDGLPPSMRPPAISAPAANTVSGSGGGNFFPAGPPAEQPPAAERTVIKQADEILADALKGAGLGDVSAPPPPIELPKAPASATGGPPRKQTLLGMPASPGVAFKLPDDVAAAAREYENKIKSEPKQEVAEAREPEPAPKATIASEPPTAKEPATRTLEGKDKKASPAPPAVKKAEPAKVVASDSRRPPPLAAAAAPAPEQKGGGAGGWLIVLLLVGAAGAGGYYLMTKGNDTPTPAPSTAPMPTPSPAPTPSPVASVSAVPTETAAPSASTPPSASVSAVPSASVSAAPSPSPATTPIAPPPPPPPTTAAPKPPPPPPTTAAPKPPPPPTSTAPKPPPKPKPTDDNPYQ